jgi:hypothetical protein
MSGIGIAMALGMGRLVWLRQSRLKP